MGRVWAVLGGLGAAWFSLALVSPNAEAQGKNQWFKKQFNEGKGGRQLNEGKGGREAVLSELQPLWDLVGKLIDAGKLTEAEATARRAIARATELRGPDGPPVAGGYGSLAKTYRAMGRYPEAEQAARRAISISQNAGNLVSVARQSGLLGGILTNQGRHGEAEALFTRSLAALERDPGPEHIYTAELFHQFGMLRNEQGRHVEAERLERRALQIIDKAKTPPDAFRAHVLAILGRVLSNLGRYAEAEDNLKRAIAIGDSAFGAKSFERAKTLRLLGEVYSSTGRFAEAEQMLRRSIESFENTVGLQHRAAIFSLRALGAVKLQTGEFAEAETILKRALASTAKTDLNNVTKINLLLGRAVGQQGRTEEAARHLKSGLEAAEHFGKDSPYVASALLRLGQHYMEERRFDEAKLALERALSSAELIKNVSLPRTLVQLGDLNLQIKRPSDALDNFKRAALALEARRERSAAQVDDRFNDEIGPLARWVALGFARAAWELDKRDDRYRSDAFLHAQSDNESVASAAIRQMATRFSATDDAIGRLVRTDQDLLQRWQAIDRQLTSGLQEDSIDPNTRRALRTELDEITKEISDTKRRISSEFPKYAALTRAAPLSIADIQRQLAPDEAMLAFLVGEDQSFVWAIGKGEATWQRLELGQEALSARVARLRKGLDIGELQKNAGTGTVELFDLELAHQLYQELVAPVERALEGKRTVLVVPSGPLTSLPFHLLVSRAPVSPITELTRIPEYRNADWLAKRYAIAMLPSVGSVRALREVAKTAPGAKPLIGFGDPVFGSETASIALTSSRESTTRRATRAYNAYWKGGAVDLAALAQGLAPLPETADELRGMAKALGARPEDLHLGRAASELTVKQSALSSYRVVYFATHGLIAGEVAGLAEPALALTTPMVGSDMDDGLLTASEVAHLKLNAEWVVLSACNTAAGDKAGAEAFSGLARAFFYAGARTLLVSHWPVNSSAAVKLTTKTFETLQKNPGLARVEALRQSMLAVMNDASDPLNAYPAFWAPFTLVGEAGQR